MLLQGNHTSWQQKVQNMVYFSHLLTILGKDGGSSSQPYSGLPATYPEQTSKFAATAFVSL